MVGSNHMRPNAIFRLAVPLLTLFGWGLDVRDRRALANAEWQSWKCSCGVTLDGDLGRALNEEAFRHLLAIERKRIEGGRGCLVLVLVTLKKHAAGYRATTPKNAAKMFRGMWRSLRETDCVGWFREGAVAGAILTQGASHPAASSVEDIRRRVDHMVSHALSTKARQGVRVRVVELKATQRA